MQRPLELVLLKCKKFTISHGLASWNVLGLYHQERILYGISVLPCFGWHPLPPNVVGICGLHFWWAKSHQRYMNTSIFMYLVDFSSRCWQSDAIGKQETLDRKNMLISFNNMLLQGKRPHAIQSNSHPLSSLVLSRFSVSCLTIWQYTSSFKGSCM